MIVKINYFSEALLLPPVTVLDDMTESENLVTDNLDATPESSNIKYTLFNYQIHYNIIVF